MGQAGHCTLLFIALGRYLRCADQFGGRAARMEKDEGDSSMPIDPKSVSKIADAYTAAWNSKSAEAVASFYAEDGQIIINRGAPWKGRSGITEMAAGF